MHESITERHKCVDAVIDPERMGEFEAMVLSMDDMMYKESESDSVHRVAFYGFGGIAFRQSFYRLLQGYLYAEWYWSSEVMPHRWEMLVSFPTRYRIPAHVLDTLCGLCKNGVSCDVFERGITNALVHFVKRIDDGKDPLGWLRRRVRTACERHRKIQEENETRRRVAEVTGMDFTSGNMIHVYYEWRNTLLDLQAHQNALCGLLSRQGMARNVISELLSTVNTMVDLMQISIQNLRDLVENHQREEMQQVVDRVRVFLVDQQSIIDHVTRRRANQFDVPDVLLSGPRLPQGVVVNIIGPRGPGPSASQGS